MALSLVKDAKESVACLAPCSFRPSVRFSTLCQFFLDKIHHSLKCFEQIRTVFDLILFRCPSRPGIWMQRAVVQKVKGDLAAEETMMEEYTKWCDSESNEKEDAITSHKRTIGDLEAEIADATARISELGTEVEELAGKISGAESELSEATKLREEEKAAFAASESELVDTVDSLERALVVLKRGQTSFLQARDQDTLKKMTMSLSPR